MNNVTTIRKLARKARKLENSPPSPLPNTDDPESNILIECAHMSGTLNLLRSAVESESIEVTENDMRSGTVIQALWSLQYGVDRVEWLMDRLADQRRANGFHSEAERAVICRGLEMLLNNCKSDGEFAIVSRLKDELHG